MSQEESISINHAIEEMRTEVLAVVGRWAIAIIGSCICLTGMAAAQWFPTVGRIEKLETWKMERAVGIDGYNQFREALEGRLSKIENTQVRQSEDIKEILSLLRRPLR